VLDFLERSQLLAEQPGRDPILPRERRIGHAVLDRLFDELLVKPIPARPGELELQHEVQRHAFLQCFLERGIERHVELGIQDVALVLGAQFRGLDRDRVAARGRRERKPERRAQAQQAEKAVRWRHATGGSEPRDPGGD
jgi:hypothetical protein